MFEFLLQVDYDLYARTKLVEHSIKVPTVYSEIQAFFHTAFKYIHLNCGLNLGIYGNNPPMIIFLNSQQFNYFLIRQLGFNDMNVVEELKDRYRNIHEHSSVVPYVKADVEKYFHSLFDLAKGIYEYFTGKSLKMKYDVSFFNDLFDEIKDLVKVKQLKNELDKVKQKEQEIVKLYEEQVLQYNNLINTHENNTNKLLLYENRIKKLENSFELNKQLQQKLDSKIKEIESLKAQVRELSQKNEYFANQYFSVRLPTTNPTGFYELAVQEKRAGNFKRALEIYRNRLYDIGLVYDYELLKAIFKSAYLYNRYDLAKACLLCLIHYEMNAFVVALNNPYNMQSNALINTFRNALNSNRFFKERLLEVEDDNLRKLMGIGVYRPDLVFWYSLITIAESNKNKELVMAFRENIQSNKNSSLEYRKIYNEHYISFEKGINCFDTMSDIIKEVKINEIDNLAVITIYNVKKLIDKI